MRACELCHGEAVVHCASDSAFLCRNCDAHVHGANFLVARHPRRLLCCECGVLDSERRPVSGLGFLPPRFVCGSCNGQPQGEDDGGDSDSESTSSSCCSSSIMRSAAAASSCVSSAGHGAAVRSGTAVETVLVAGSGGPIKAACSRSSGATEWSECTPRKRDRRARAATRRYLDLRTEAVLRTWCRRIGLDDARAPRAASHALASGARMMAGAPFRVAAAAAVWSAARLSCTEAAAMGGRRGERALLRRLEACSGVPAKLILVSECRLAQAARACQVKADDEEGWAEC